MKKSILFLSHLLFSYFIEIALSGGGLHDNALGDFSECIAKSTYLTGANGSNKISDSILNILEEGKKVYDPLLVVVLMVKNEEQVIVPTLEPYVDGGIDSFLIYDTGSTDSTMALARNFFDKRGVENGIILQDPFVDFATSRNRALQQAEERFPNACFMLMPDAEWYMHNVEGLLDFCKQHQYVSSLSYLVRIMDNYLDFYTPRLIRAHNSIRFVGVVHEVLDTGTRYQVPRDVYFELRTTRYGQEKTRQRWFRDRDLLLKEFARNPHDPRTVFYLAQTYACLGEWENACFWYEHRMNMAGWDEENFITYCRIGQAYEALKKWDQALYYYLKAYSYRPKRIESLVRLAQHYWDTQERDLCFLFARRATEVPYPETDVLFVEKELYEFARYDLLGRAAWYMGEYEMGEKAVREALKLKPNAEYLLNNLAFYMNRKQNNVASVDESDDEKALLDAVEACIAS
jgi:tetratricopeptide (TPR) repeat protein